MASLHVGVDTGTLEGHERVRWVCTRALSPFLGRSVAPGHDRAHAPTAPRVGRRAPRSAMRRGAAGLRDDWSQLHQLRHERGRETAMPDLPSPLTCFARPVPSNSPRDNSRNPGRAWLRCAAVYTRNWTTKARWHFMRFVGVLDVGSWSTTGLPPKTTDFRSPLGFQCTTHDGKDAAVAGRTDTASASDCLLRQRGATQ